MFFVFSPANARAVLGGQGYGNSTEGYWLTSVQCDGSEDNITICNRSNWGNVTGCQVTEAAGVSCLPDSSALPQRTIFCLFLAKIHRIVGYNSPVVYRYPYFIKTICCTTGLVISRETDGWSAIVIRRSLSVCLSSACNASV